MGELCHGAQARHRIVVHQVPRRARFAGAQRGQFVAQSFHQIRSL